MSMLSRYRKTGGFLQLLTLLEGSEPEKQKNLIALIAAEDPGWAHLASIKMLTFEKISRWPAEAFAEITPHMLPIQAKQAYCLFPKEARVLWKKALPQRNQREIAEEFENKILTPSEAFATKVKLLQTVRELSQKGLFSLSRFEPSLVIDQRLAG